jgi:Icc-related predicted phosphoesterase
VLERALGVVLLAVGLGVPSGCQRPAEDRAARDLEIGKAGDGTLAVRVVGGLAAVRELSPSRLVLWCSAPGLEIELEARETRRLTLELRNVMSSVVLSVLDPGDGLARALPSDLATIKRYELTIPAGTTRLRVGAPGADGEGAFRFALMSDVQEAIGRVQDLFSRMNEEPDLDFLLGAGDLTQQGTVEQLVRYQKELRELDIPYYTTLGNHELGTTPPPYQDYLGRASFHFVHRGVRFSMLDSGSATLDPTVDGWLDVWLAAGRDHVHVVAMHIPPLDPVGVRNGAFGSRSEAAALLARLAQAHVDLTLYGHIHSYYAFDNAGIPAFISGGGGALPERFDDIGRHFVVIDVDARRGVVGSRIVRVD